MQMNVTYCIAESGISEAGRELSVLAVYYAAALLARAVAFFSSLVRGKVGRRCGSVCIGIGIIIFACCKLGFASPDAAGAYGIAFFFGMIAIVCSLMGEYCVHDEVTKPK